MIHPKLPLVFLLLYGASVFAQNEIKRPITIQEAIMLGTQNSKSIQLSKLKIESAEAKQENAINPFLPNVSVTAAYTRLSTNIDPYKISIPGVFTTELNPVIPNQFYNRASIQQTLFAGLRNIYNLKAAKEILEASKIDTKKEEDELKLIVIQQYYNYCKSLSSQKIIDENAKTIDNRLKDIQNFNTVGMALQNDVLKAQLAKSSLDVTKLEMENVTSIVNYNLAILLGIDEKTTLEPNLTELEKSNTNPNPRDIESATVSRAEYKSALLKINAGNYLMKSAKSAYYPTLAGGFNFYYNNPNQRVFPQQDKFKDTWDAGLTLNWNLSSLYTARAGIKDAKINTKLNEMMTAQLQDGIKTEAFTALKNYQLNIKKIELADKTVQQAKENQRIMKNRFTGEMSVFADLLDADAQLFQAELNLINAKCDAKVAYYKYLKAIGQLN
ncbi:MAG: TolC family protein [Chitinophagales bacterium]|nr:TolC family protein [Chitinophagales bacterium]